MREGEVYTKETKSKSIQRQIHVVGENKSLKLLEKKTSV